MKTNETNATGKIEAQSTYDDLSAFVDQWLLDADAEHLSLLGEFRTGKSWFALKYSYDLITSYREARRLGSVRPRIPLLIRLRDYARGFKDVGSLLTEFVFREHQINIPNYEVLKTLNSMGRLLFIFDGFDEMAARVDREKMIDNFWSLAAVLGPGSKAILTCRTEYFRFAQEAQNVFAGREKAGTSDQSIIDPARFQTASIQMLDDQRIRAVLSRRADPTVVETVLSNPKLSDLAKRPVMIDLLIEAMPSLKSDKADLASVYFQAVKRKMERDIRSGRTFTTMADKTFFLCEMSWEMLTNQQLKFHFKEIPEHIREYFGVSKGSIEEDFWRHDLLSQTMLVRDDSGYYRPAHKSLVEFFAAYKLTATLGALRHEYLSLVDRDSMAPEQSSVAMTWSSYFSTKPSSLRRNSALKEFSIDSHESLANSWAKMKPDNAISEMILLLSGRDILLAATRGLLWKHANNLLVSARVLEVIGFQKDISGCDLSKVEASGCKLSECNFSNSNLSGSFWQGCSFDGVTFDNACLRDATFQSVKQDNVTFRNTDLTNAAFTESGYVLVSVLGAAWVISGNEEALLVVLRDLRKFVIWIEGKRIEELQSGSPGLDGKDLGFEAFHSIHLETLKSIPIEGSGWLVGKAWDLDGLQSDLCGEFRTSMTGPHGDVEVRYITVKDTATDATVFKGELHDATDYNGSIAERAICISKSGGLLAFLGGKYAEPENATLMVGSRQTTIRLEDFRGSDVYMGPETMDKRGASFNRAASILAINEQPNMIGFWDTANGKCLGHIRFESTLVGATIDGVKGLSESLLDANIDGRGGWEFEKVTTRLDNAN